jgi:ribosomal protein S1
MFPSSRKKLSPKGFAAVGDEMEAVVLNVDTSEKKIALPSKH